MATPILPSVVVLILAVLFLNGIHMVREGHVGVYWRGGALLSRISTPGFHVKIPLLTRFEEVQVTVQTDAVTSIPCGTSGGVLIQFDKVEVVNRLHSRFVYETVKNYTVHYDRTWIFDKIHHEINQFCSGHTLQEVYITLFDTLDESLQVAIQRDCNIWAPGIEIIAVRVTKPRIPEQIRRNYEMMEAEKTKLLIATEALKVAEKEAETERLQATIAAQMRADVSSIHMKMEIAQKEAQQKIAAVQDIMHSNRQHALADADYYKSMKEADANDKKLTPHYLEYMHILSLSNNTKVYFGEKIPNMMLERRSAASTTPVTNIPAAPAGRLP